ncbi:bifunctional proline dehydrogenase/L-glutamate gamma-semialdehyde dehydrogenase PutA [Echinimonas agarilytica]|uniref:Bifunctional protein PutA n=1 Tax=Echinimonas agarilytica TaxID=1215918 RepID=A0AA42B8M5_9GAMM|nr:bifunctional proline dehydrogenase/L-glutamate gamma-semialdehyde dehydrogenase PutA [Echinimonas agarilytica]MCM2680381.1 bifunctional proline dehydrogenase/L-glutamate gamma-semialdehyde dehydrogenase PutA [Echinimonas agarilytica]
MSDNKYWLTNAPIDSDLETLKQNISEHYLLDESSTVQHLLSMLPDDDVQLLSLCKRAEQLVEQVRTDNSGDGLDAFLQQYSLDTHEGIVLMCLAEALLRIPDAETADALIRDKISTTDWTKYLKASDSVFVNASTWGLMLTGKVISPSSAIDDKPDKLLNRLVGKLGEPIVRQAMYAAMKIMGKQFVLGTTIKNALKAATENRRQGYWHSFDMLGESALSQDDSNFYLKAYMQAIESAAEQAQKDKSHPKSATISIKLSALHPRYEVAQKSRVMRELIDDVLPLIKRGRELDIGITIDAEEADRQELAIAVFQRLYQHDNVKGWGHLGMAVQAYSKAALPVLHWLNALSHQQGDEIPVRLVKGAYWDTEIKLAQSLGLPYYPVFTRKANTDVSYLACASFLLSDHTRGNIYPQFATHNAHTVVSIIDMAGKREFEFQRLHGMGEELYDLVLKQYPSIHCRIYAPVGNHKDLLPYLVRRLLENGANTSFVHKLMDPKVPARELSGHPVLHLRDKNTLANDKIPLPPNIFSDRKNSLGTNLHIAAMSQPFYEALAQWQTHQWQGASMINGKSTGQKNRDVQSPALHSDIVGQVNDSDAQQVSQAIEVAYSAFPGWKHTPVQQRAWLLLRLADSLEQNKSELIALCVREAGKTLQDSIDEVREAVDFCRYYARQSELKFCNPMVMPGPTGESNILGFSGRGVFACISPWNFPLAIFIGQIAAALAAGNTVVAKPAEQTSLIATRTFELMFEIGFPTDVVQLICGDGATVGNTLTSDPRISGVVFTGSTNTAMRINQTLAARTGSIVPFIAETGGQNAMIVDSTALPEQVVTDAVHSAFASAGQRCSALRVMYVQEDIADRVITLLKGAMAELKVGHPSHYSSDLGPVIDQAAQTKLLAHIEAITTSGQLIYQTPLAADAQQGYFVPPTAIEIEGIEQLSEEQFGPILHVVRFKAKELNKIVDSINGTGFGLTLGIHSRNEGRAQQIAQRINVGNVYINRDQIGAMVGVQPFGGQGLSGTGPKAGGPQYLLRFATEKTITNNVTAIGGNATLLTLGDA